MISKVPKRRISRNGCLSCKKLKIKCNEAKPICEYCRHTRRVCVYPDTVANQLTKLSRTIVSDFLTTKLNQPSTQLKLTRYELRLLTDFNQRCLASVAKEPNQDGNLNWSELPHEIIRSDLVRLSVFAFASSLDNRDLPELHRIDNFLDGDDTNLYNSIILKQYLSSAQLFNQSISKLNNIISNNIDATTTTIKYDTALEILISSLLVFYYLNLSPLKMVPLLSPDRANPDLMSIIKGMQHTLEISANSFNGTPLQGIYDAQFEIETNTPPPYILITDLENDLPNTSDPDYSILLDAIDSLHRGLVTAVESGDNIPLTRWLLCLKSQFYDLLYLENRLALRLLYTYSCLLMLMRFFRSESENIWREFVTTHKNKMFCQYGQWTNPHDEALYVLAVDIQLRTLKGKYMIFDNLDPIGLVHFCQFASNDSPDFTTSGLSSTTSTPVFTES